MEIKCPYSLKHYNNKKLQDEKDFFMDYNAKN